MRIAFVNFILLVLLASAVYACTTSTPPLDARGGDATGDVQDARADVATGALTVEQTPAPSNPQPGHVFDTGVRGNSAESVTVTYRWPARDGSDVVVPGVAFAANGNVYAAVPWTESTDPIAVHIESDGTTLRDMSFSVAPLEARATATRGSVVSAELDRAEAAIQALNPALPAVTRARAVIARLRTVLQAAQAAEIHYGDVSSPNAENVRLILDGGYLDLVDAFLLNLRDSMPSGVEAHIACRSSFADTLTCVAVGAALITGSIPLAAMGTAVAIGSLIINVMEAEGIGAAQGVPGPVTSAYNSMLDSLTDLGAHFSRAPLSDGVDDAAHILCDTVSCPMPTCALPGDACCAGGCPNGSMLACNPLTDSCDACYGVGYQTCFETDCCPGLQWIACPTCGGCTGICTAR